MIPGRKRSTNDEATFPCRKLTKNENAGRDSEELEKSYVPEGTMHYGKETKWVSPIDGSKQEMGRKVECGLHRRHDSFFWNSKEHNPRAGVDFNNSMISLDFGLISPKRNWCSPPQRIERAENREWSPHRVLDRPNLENSPGNWISVKECCQRSVPTGDIGKADEIEFVSPCTVQVQRSASQNTYVLPEKVLVPVSPRIESRPTRKTCILSDYQPDRGGSGSIWKKPCATESKGENKNLPAVDKTDIGGRVVKISLLDDFRIPGFGKVSIERNADETEKENFQGEPHRKITKSRLNSMANLKNSARSVKSISSIEKAKKKEESKEKQQEARRKEEMKEEKQNGDRTDNLIKGTRDMIADLENILRDKESMPLKEEIAKVEKPKSKAIEKEIPAAEKRKRKIDSKGVQEFIRNQKQKRLEQVKTEKKSKVEEKEAIKKKLEELRVKTLKLAAQSKKKKSSVESAVKIVENVTEDDVTASLGLKQVKPKISYSESISNLKRKIPQAKSLHAKSDAETENLEEDRRKVAENPEVERPEPEVVRISVEPPAQEPSSVNVASRNNLNSTLKKLAEILHLKIEEKERRFRSRPTSVKSSKSVKDSPTRMISDESVNKAGPEINSQTAAVNLDTIQTLRDDIKKISENFNVLHRILLEKAHLNESNSPEREGGGKFADANGECDFVVTPEKPEKIAQWQKNLWLKAHPYNVYTAMRRKMNSWDSKSISSASSRVSSTYAETFSNKCGGHFEALSLPSYRLLSVKSVVRRKRISSKSTANSADENYFGSNDSGSEFSSSILDSERNPISSVETRNGEIAGRFPKSSVPETKTCSAVTETASKNHRSPSLINESDSLKISAVDFDEERRSLILVTPDVKLISTESSPKKSYDPGKNVDSIREPTNVFSGKSSESKCRRKTDSTITEIIDELTSGNEKVGKSVDDPDGVVNARRSYFQPEMLHLQFQAELILLETFQQSLSRFLEAERTKTLSEVTKIVYEKSVGTEKPTEKEDRGVQTTWSQQETDGGETSDDDETKTDVSDRSVRTKKNASSENRVVLNDGSKTKDDGKSTETADKSSRSTGSGEKDSGDEPNGVAFETLDRMMKSEELRSEHQLALMRLREKTLNEKVKAELTFLEMKRRALKDGVANDEENASVIRKRQRGILVRYQSEREEIERLKKMHEMASEEKKLMVKQQRQIRQMQTSTENALTKSRRRRKLQNESANGIESPERSSEIREEIDPISDSIPTESVRSPDDSNGNYLAAKNNGESEIDEGRSSKRRRGTEMAMKSICSSDPTAEESLGRTKESVEMENRIRESGRETSGSKMEKRRSMRDASTSPFAFAEECRFFRREKSSCSRERVDESSKSADDHVSYEGKTTEKTKPETGTGNCCSSSDIPTRFSKTIASTSTNLEYNSESFESLSSSETPKAGFVDTRSKSAGTEGSYKSVPIKLSLSPRLGSPRRRYSSGSDDSLNLSTHTETASEQSDLEIRIATLREELRKRKLEAERLRREQKRVQKERLKVKEQSLIKQMQAYDAYIQKKKRELEEEYERSREAIRKPAIKQPKAAEKWKPKRQEPLLPNEGDRIRFHARAVAKKASESDGEISERIEKDAAAESEKTKNESESVREERSESYREIETESALWERTEGSGEGRKAEEENNEFEDGVSIADVKTISEATETVKVTVEPEESPTEATFDSDGSDEHSGSVKTTVHGPDAETIESNEGTESIQDVEEECGENDVSGKTYRSDSFESDIEETESKAGQRQKKSSEPSEVETDFSVERTPSSVGGKGEEPERKKEERARKEEGPELKEKDVSVVGGGDSRVVREVTSSKVEEERSQAISDSIICDILTDSVRLFAARKSDVEKRFGEAAEMNLRMTLSDLFFAEILTETMDESFKLFDGKRKLNATGDGIDSEEGKNRFDVSDRESEEIPEEDEEKRQESKMADSGETTSDDASENISLREMNSAGKEERSIEIFPACESNHQTNNNKTFGQECLVDDSGLSRTRREAEVLRLQQHQIEQEIQQLQSQRENIPYFYLREIPNKPPPPYTPPAKPSSEIPTTESEILAVTSLAVRMIAEEMRSGKSDLESIEPSSDYMGNLAGEHVGCYKLFLFDLAKHIVEEVISHQEKGKEVVLPWEKIRETLSACKYYGIERTPNRLNELVRNKVLLLFGFKKRVVKASLMMKCCKKKRDHVDEILVSESQEEESDWTTFDRDQVSLKNELTLAILDDLLEESTRRIKVIFGKKMKGSE